MQCFHDVYKSDLSSFISTYLQKSCLVFQFSNVKIDLNHTGTYIRQNTMGGGGGGGA